MRNKGFIVFAALVCAALAVGGIALADVQSGSASAVSATFDATSVIRGIQKQCTVVGGDTYTYTRAVYKGAAASSDARFNGPIRLVIQSEIDNTSGVGALIGTYRINPGTAGVAGWIDGSVSAGQLSGIARGHAMAPWGELFAGANGGFTAAGGFTGVSIGTGTAPSSGVLLQPGACVRALYLP